MATSDEPKGRYPKASGLQDGAKHGYIGNVEVYDPNEPGHTNATNEKASKGDSAKPVVGLVGKTKSDDADDA